MPKVKCGDANPSGNVWVLFKGGCGKELDIKDAYRCTGCGGWFHLNCIFNHFEQEKDHDYSRNALKKIFDHITIATTKGQIVNIHKILKLSISGLNRKLNKKRLKI